MKLILASSSPFRRQLLSRLMIPFDVVSPDIDETPVQSESAPDLVRRLSIEKAKTVAERYERALVIGSDQVAVHDGEIIGKPHNHEQAVRQLENASGKSIVLYTGLAVVNTQSESIHSDVIPYQVKFKKLSSAQIKRYLEKEKPYGCSGSLRADGLGVALLEKFSGDDPSALIGLPLVRLVSMLEAEGMPPV